MRQPLFPQRPYLDRTSCFTKRGRFGYDGSVASLKMRPAYNSHKTRGRAVATTIAEK